MKLIVRNHIVKLKKQQFEVEEFLTKKMLENKKEREIWISGQNLLK